MRRSHLAAGERDPLDTIARNLGHRSELARALRTFAVPPSRRLRLLVAGVVLTPLLAAPVLTAALGAPWPTVALAGIPATGATGALTVWALRADATP